MVKIIIPYDIFLLFFHIQNTAEQWINFQTPPNFIMAKSPKNQYGGKIDGWWCDAFTKASQCLEETTRRQMVLETNLGMVEIVREQQSSNLPQDDSRTHLFWTDVLKGQH